MSLIAHLRSRYGLYRVRLQPDKADDRKTEERLRDVLHRTEALRDGSSWMPGCSADYYTVGREGFRVVTPEYPGIEGVEVMGSRRVIREIAEMWRQEALAEPDTGS